MIAGSLLKRIIGTRIIFLIFVFLKYLFCINIERPKKRRYLPHFVLSKYFSIGYNYFFDKLDFKRAYYLRVLQAIHVHGGYLIGDKAKAKNYLYLMSGEDLLDFIGIKDIHPKEFQSNEDFDRLLKFKAPNQVFCKSILICGPKTDFSNLNIDDYDLLVFNKVPDIEIIKRAKNVVICTGNQWFLKNRIHLKVLDQKFKNLKIYSTTKDSFSFYSEVFDLLPESFEGSSLMNLQRTLLLISSNYQSKSIKVIGYDLFLSKAPKNLWYESQAIKNHNDSKTNIISSVKIHDYLMNYNFLRLFIKYNETVQFSDEINLNMNFVSLQRKFSKFYG